MKKIILTLFFTAVFQVVTFDSELLADSQKLDAAIFVSDNSRAHSKVTISGFIAIINIADYFHRDKILCENNSAQPVKIVCSSLKDFQYLTVNQIYPIQFPLRL